MAALRECHAVCLSTAMVHCLERGGEQARPQHLRLMLDCAAAASFAADALGRKSQFHNGIAALTADISEVCARDCIALGGMEACVDACEKSALLCRKVARLDHAEIWGMAARLPPS